MSLEGEWKKGKVEAEVKNPEEDVCILPRASWAAREPYYKEPLEIPIMYMCITYREPPSHLNDEGEVLREMQRHDMEVRGMPDIESNFFVGKGGTIYEGRGWFTRPSLGIKYTPNMKLNLGKYFQVTYIDDYETDPPNNPLLKAAATLIPFGLKKKLISHGMRFIEVKIVKGDKVTFQSVYN